MNDITITLIIPVYNVEKYLVQCLESVIDQTESFDEVIIVNDGSTDHSGQLCEKFVNNYDYFKLICQDNRGLSAARNAGIALASCGYIMFLDSDDYLRKDTVSVLKEHLMRDELDAIYFDMSAFYDDYNNKHFRVIENRDYLKLDNMNVSGWNFFKKCYPRDYMVSACLAVYKKSLLKKNRLKFPEGIYYEDNYFTFRFLIHAEHVIHLSEQLYKRRYRLDSIMTSTYSERKFKDYIKCIHLIWNNIQCMEYGQLREKRELLLQFVSDHYDVILNNYHDCKRQKILLYEEAEALLQQITKQYFLLLNLLEFDVATVSLANLVMVMKNFFRIQQWKLKQGAVAETVMQSMAFVQKQYYQKILKEIPLDKPDLKIGIYGTGNHTEGLLAIYEKIMGDIRCKLTFIDSRKDNEMYKNAPLIHYQKIGQYFDCIIISSFLYEQEMICNINNLPLEIPIYRFYENLTTDIFSNYQILLKYI